MDPAVWDLAAGGFRDTSRLAASDVTMMLDTLITNRPVLQQLLQDVADELIDMQASLSAGQEEALRQSLDEAAQARRGWKP